MIIVTGGAGFIGSRLVAGFNRQGRSDIIVVDHLKDGKKFINLVNCDIQDYWDRDQLLDKIVSLTQIEAIYHMGACSTTTEWDGQYMMQNNFEYSKQLLEFCLTHQIPFYYASSAATYGNGQTFIESRENEKPINVYGYSKFLFDEYARRQYSRAKSAVVGFRFFNVYGPNEQHKGSMASVAYHFNQQLQATGQLKLFEGTDGYANGEQRRDFVYVDDVVEAMLWFLQQPKSMGVFNLGTGKSQTFNDVARAVIAFYGRGEISYIPFPEHLKGAYQSYTQADLNALRQAGCPVKFRSVEQGVAAYLDQLHTQ